jgi:hypothetical protein
MEITHEFFGREYEIVFDIKITAPACAETGPTYDCGGEPASPVEWEIDGEPELFTLKITDCVAYFWSEPADTYALGPAKKWVRDQPLEMPGWLKEAVTEWLMESDDVACMADDLAADDGRDPDREREDRAEYLAECRRDDSEPLVEAFGE